MTIEEQLHLVFGLLAGTVFGVLLYACVDWADKKIAEHKVKKAIAPLESKLASLGEMVAGKTMMGQDQQEYNIKLQALAAHTCKPFIAHPPTIQQITIPIARAKNGRFKRNPKKK